MNEVRYKMTWGSHVPINTALINTFNITGVMELGMGDNSTNLFRRLCDSVVSIETDEEYANQFESTDRHRVVHHPVPHHIERFTRRYEIADDVLKVLDEKYIETLKCAYRDDLNMLFIDCISSHRWPALIEMHQYFDVIVCHDYENRPGEGRQLHWNKGEFKHSTDYRMFVDRSYPAHTAILIDIDICTESKFKQLQEEHQKALHDWIDVPSVIGEL